MLMNYLSEIVRCGNLFLGRKLKSQNCNYSEHFVMMFLASGRKVNQETIAGYFKLDKGTIAKIHSKMEQKGLVTRTENPENHREKLVSLSLEGINKKESMQNLRVEWDRAIYHDISQGDIQTLNQLLGKLAENAKEAVKSLG